MVKKTPANPGAESAAQGDPVAPWTRGNNCPQLSEGVRKETVDDSWTEKQLVHDEESREFEVAKLLAKERPLLCVCEKHAGESNTS